MSGLARSRSRGQRPNQTDKPRRAAPPRTPSPYAGSGLKPALLASVALAALLVRPAAAVCVTHANCVFEESFCSSSNVCEECQHCGSDGSFDNGCLGQCFPDCSAHECPAGAFCTPNHFCVLCADCVDGECPDSCGTVEACDTDADCVFQESFCSSSNVCEECQRCGSDGGFDNGCLGQCFTDCSAHEECPAGAFCDFLEFCEPCADCVDEDAVDGACPDSCGTVAACDTHAECVFRESFCSSSNVCEECQHCGSDGSFDNGCLGQCFTDCSAHEECPAGTFCDFLEFCEPCADCVDEDAVDGACPDSCGTVAACDTHADCVFRESFCSSSNVCEECQHCGSDGSFDNGCLGQCFTDCSAHEECPAGTFCDFLEFCEPCAECDDEEAVDGACPDSCEGTYFDECSAHEECTGEDSFCAYWGCAECRSCRDTSESIDFTCPEGCGPGSYRTPCASHAECPAAGTFCSSLGVCAVCEQCHSDGEGVDGACLDLCGDANERFCVNATAVAVAGFPKVVQVFGLAVLGTATTDDSVLLHCAAVLAQFLDNDADGAADDPLLLQHMLEADAALLVLTLEDGPDPRVNIFDIFETLEWCFKHRVVVAESVVLDLSADSADFDSAVVEAAALIVEGYSRAYPAEFGLTDSALSEAMDTARGGRYEDLYPQDGEYPPSAWYKPPEMLGGRSYGLLVQVYFTVALLTFVGAFVLPPGRHEDANEWFWAPGNATALEATDAAAWALLTDPALDLPRALPDGDYGGGGVALVVEDSSL
eukprot:scaffold641_cov490-Prasinococcus_capsulatus_cf.AAC.17